MSQPSTADVAMRVNLVIDTATSEIVAAIASLDGRLLRSESWPAGHRHGQTLLPAIERLAGESGDGRSGIAGIVVGTGPGAFTGLRVGIATAKGIATSLGVSIVGVATSEALTAAAASVSGVPSERIVLVLPAGPRDRVVCRAGQSPLLLPAGDEPDVASDERLCAVDLEGRASMEAVELGRLARDGLAATLADLGGRRLRVGDADDLATLVAEYVTLPRGVREMAGEMAWSHGPR